MACIIARTTYLVYHYSCPHIVTVNEMFNKQCHFFIFYFGQQTLFSFNFIFQYYVFILCVDSDCIFFIIQGVWSNFKI
jgi:hypothetical protein